MSPAAPLWPPVVLGIYLGRKNIFFIYLVFITSIIHSSLKEMAKRAMSTTQENL